MYTLGIWDGHDSGAALIEDGMILFAANEERYTKRKLEVAFPQHSIRAALSSAGISPKDIDVVAYPTIEFTKTLSRLFPWQKESYYLFRRRKMMKPRFEALRHYAKYAMTSVGVLPLCKGISNTAIKIELRHMGFGKHKLYAIDHHASHVAAAAFTSGFRKALVITLDGLGDGLSGTISVFSKGRLKRSHSIPARDSIGIFYEQVTNIMGMRELEDEGKVMAMADYSYPFSFEENRLKDFFTVEGIAIKARYGPLKQYDLLSRIAWSMPREQFSYMAQQLLEQVTARFVGNAVEEAGISHIALAGGVMSNVKANMKVRDLASVKDMYIFPHMGDGGIALGAAMYANYLIRGTAGYSFENAYLGNGYADAEVKGALRSTNGISYAEESDAAVHAAELILDGEYVFWFNGRMEYGPRALGNRSILAAAGSDEVKDRLNLYVKKREWYQPFAPSMLKEEAKRLLHPVKAYDRFMTTAYRVRRERSHIMKSVMHVDMTARPQMLGSENKEYRKILLRIKKGTGYGVVLNTSFNVHGMPIVLSPEDALYTMKKTGARHLFLNGYYVENRKAKRKA